MQTSKNSSHTNNNFDFMRLVAALMVIEGHAYAIATTNQLEPLQKLLKSTYSGHIAVSIFFLISGYLVTKSYVSQNSLFRYSVGRILRIIPGITASTLLTVFVIIPIVFSLIGKLPSNYFIQPSTHAYLKNILLYPLQFSITNIIFSNNANGTSINGSLWTLSYEFTCYIVIAILGVLGLLKKAVILLCFTIFFILFTFKVQHAPIELPYQGFSSLTEFLSLFFCGALYYSWKDKIVYSLKYVVINIVILSYFGFIGKYFNTAFVIFGSYLVFYAAFKVRMSVNSIGKYGDFSYGIYIYGFLIEQCVVLLSAHYMHYNISPCQLTLIATPITILFALMSWYIIEAPCLRLKGYLNQCIRI